MNGNGGINLSGLGVLVIEPNMHIRSLIRQMLHDLGVREIYDANNSDIATEQLNSRIINLILIDDELEPMGGVPWTKMARTSPKTPDPNVPIILLSQQVEARMVVQARDAGVTDFLVKPFSLNQLQMRIKVALEKPRPLIRSDDFVGPDRRRRMTQWTRPERRNNRQQRSA